MAIFALFCGAVLSYGLDMKEYDSYDKETIAVITGIDTKENYIKTFSYNEYKVSYAYSVDGKGYNGITPWMANIKEPIEGDQVKARYNSDVPESSMLELEKDSHTGDFSTIIMIFVAFIAFLAMNINIKRKE